MEIIKKFIPNNMHYKNNKIISVKSLVLHSVGCSQPDPDVFVRIWNTTSNKYLTQLLIGAEKCYEVLECTRIKGKAVFCWHVGSANGYSIGAEMTEPSTIKYTGGSTWTDLNPTKTKAHVMATYENAVDVFAQLCNIHGLDPLKDGVILSHKECHDRGIGTNHGDVEHIWKKYGLTMDQFRKDVYNAMSGKKLEPAKSVPYKVRVSITDLNIRTGPSTLYDRIAYIPPNVYTIVEVNGSWGRLKSKQKYKGKWVDGWIHLGYTTKI